jgi:hypothetical protein
MPSNTHKLVVCLGRSANYGGIEVDGEEEFRVTYTYRPGHPGQTYGPPERCYPPEPPEIEITLVEEPDRGFDGRGKGWRRVSKDPTGHDPHDDLADEIIDKCWDELVEAADDDHAADEDRAAEDRAERMREERESLTGDAQNRRTIL